MMLMDILATVTNGFLLLVSTLALAGGRLKDTEYKVTAFVLCSAILTIIAIWS